MKKTTAAAAGAIAMLLTAVQAQAAGGDPKAGAKIFVQCAACHKIDTTGRSTIGPNLNKVVGRPSASLAGFKYSPAMAAAKKVWTEAALDAFLAAPMKTVPGTRMAFAGLSRPDDRKNVIAYLKSAAK